MALTFITQAKFLGVTPTKNPGYATATFVLPETYRGIDITIDQQVEPNCRITMKAEEMTIVQPLKIGEKYQVKLAVSVGQPKGNYGANLNFDLLQVGQPAAPR